jgi:hypothetical protein
LPDYAPSFAETFTSSDSRDAPKRHFGKRTCSSYNDGTKMVRRIGVRHSERCDSSYQIARDESELLLTAHTYFFNVVKLLPVAHLNEVDGRERMDVARPW